MNSPVAERAVSDATRVGKALLKFISANDVGKTGSHQYGFYLPKGAWQFFSPHAPEKGVVRDSWPAVTWQDGNTTKSRVIWYGAGTRSEYRLTRFGKDFPWRTDDAIGNLLVLIPESLDRFLIYVLDLEEDIEYVQAALGAEVIGWATYDAGGAGTPVTEDECVDRKLREFAETVAAFPDTRTMSAAARATLFDCLKHLQQKSADDQIMRFLGSEYRLFKLIERKICGPDVQRLFTDIDDFLAVANSIMQRRKSRAGRSLEHHVEHLLRAARVPFEVRPENVEGEPDILIPSAKAYHDADYPEDKLMMVGLKTTCKDRWPQILQEAPRLKHRHVLTLQEGISAAQLSKMARANLSVVVPKPLHSMYPKVEGVQLMDLAGFIDSVRRVHG
jgi:hypothetical protein